MAAAAGLDELRDVDARRRVRSRRQVDQADQGVDHASAAESAGTAGDQEDADALVGEVAHVARELQAVVGEAEHQRVVRQPGVIQRAQHASERGVHHARPP